MSDAVELQAVIDRVGKERFESACSWAWRTAAGTGRSSETSVDWPDELEDVPHDLADVVWFEGDAPWRERVALAFALYRQMPCYANLMYAHSLSEWDDETLEAFWAEYRSLISDNDDRLADPIAYSLWCGDFEDTHRVEQAWREIAQSTALTERGLERLLDVAGPVPYRLKAPLYESLVRDQRWHLAIFRSLLNSAFDVYGDLEVASARHLLARLDLPERTEGLADLVQKLDT